MQITKPFTKKKKTQGRVFFVQTARGTRQGRHVLHKKYFLLNYQQNLEERKKDGHEIKSVPARH
jgi:hypothetical protein